MDLAILITSLVVGFFLAGLALERQVKYRRTLERLVQAEIDRVTTAKYLLEAHQELENYRLGRYRGICKVPFNFQGVGI
jgi:CHASE1-domain containing sensor protein